MAWQKIILVTVVLLIGMYFTGGKLVLYNLMSIDFFTKGNCKALKARIYNGQDAKIEDYPYQASFRINNSLQCGGSIISEKHILTASHCYNKDMVPPYLGLTVVTGTNHLKIGGNHHKIANIIVHPNCRVRPDNLGALEDVAVITLKDPIVFDKYQQKLNLPDKNYVFGTKANVTGWGIAADRRVPDKLQRMETTIISRKDCHNKIMRAVKKEAKIYDSEICTFNSIGIGACHGDSGGPLVVNGEVVGVVSWADGKNCAGSHPVIFTNVHEQRDFIKSATGGTV